MKMIINIRILVIFALGITFLGNFGCKEKEYPVPTPSSQAKFTYQIDTLVVDEEIIGFELHFSNQSINATSYFWDFGNGDTSTEENPSYTFLEQGTYVVTLSITSENDLHYNKLSYSESLRLLVKLVLLLEPFDGEGADTPTTWLPEGWLSIDADGDGQNWYFNYYQGSGYMLSRSYLSGAALTPDNWLITPEIDLTDVGDNAEIWLNYNVCPTANTPIYRTEFYGVFVSTSGTDPIDFEEIFSEALSEDMVNWVYVLRELSLDEFKGEKIRVAFRHFQSSDKDRIVIDDVEVFITEN